MVNFLLLLWSCTPKPITIPPPPPPPKNRPIINKAPQRSLIMLAWYHTHQGQWTQAEESFQKAHQLSPTDPWIFLSWGDAAEEVNNGERAVWAWNQALSYTSVKDIEIRTLLYQKIDAYH